MWINPAPANDQIDADEDQYGGRDQRRSILQKARVARDQDGAAKNRHNAPGEPVIAAVTNFRSGDGVHIGFLSCVSYDRNTSGRNGEAVPGYGFLQPARWIYPYNLKTTGTEKIMP
jgi:hypothetical protein